MPELEFHERAKGFADALLANRTCSVLRRLKSEGRSSALEEDERVVLTNAAELVESCERGLSTVRQESVSEMGFLAWMESLRACEVALDALVRARLVTAEKDIAFTLDSAKKTLLQVLSGKMPAAIEEAISFFDALSEINIEAVGEPEPASPQPLPSPEELLA